MFRVQRKLSSVTDAAAGAAGIAGAATPDAFGADSAAVSVVRNFGTCLFGRPTYCSASSVRCCLERVVQLEDHHEDRTAAVAVAAFASVAVAS